MHILICIHIYIYVLLHMYISIYIYIYIYYILLLSLRREESSVLPAMSTQAPRPRGILLHCYITLLYYYIQLYYIIILHHSILHYYIQLYGRFPKFHRVFVGPRPWHIEIRHRVKKTSTIDLFGFDTQIKNSKIEIMETERMSCMRNLLGWLRLGWLKIHDIAFT